MPPCRRYYQAVQEAGRSTSALALADMSATVERSSSAACGTYDVVNLDVEAPCCMHASTSRDVITLPLQDRVRTTQLASSQCRAYVLLSGAAPCAPFV